MQDKETITKMSQLVERMEKLCERIEKAHSEKQQLDKSISDAVADGTAPIDYYRCW